MSLTTTSPVILDTVVTTANEWRVSKVLIHTEETTTDESGNPVTIEPYIDVVVESMLAGVVVKTEEQQVRGAGAQTLIDRIESQAYTYAQNTGMIPAEAT